MFGCVFSTMFSSSLFFKGFIPFIILFISFILYDRYLKKRSKDERA